MKLKTSYIIEIIALLKVVDDAPCESAYIFRVIWIWKLMNITLGWMSCIVLVLTSCRFETHQSFSATNDSSSARGWRRWRIVCIPTAALRRLFFKERTFSISRRWKKMRWGIRKIICSKNYRLEINLTNFLRSPYTIKFWGTSRRTVSLG